MIQVEGSRRFEVVKGNYSIAVLNSRTARVAIRDLEKVFGAVSVTEITNQR